MIDLSQETEALAKRLAATQNLSIEDAVRLALEEKARATGIAPILCATRAGTPEAIAVRRANTDRFVAELAAMPILDARPPREIMDDLNAL